MLKDSFCHSSIHDETPRGSFEGSPGIPGRILRDCRVYGRFRRRATSIGGRSYDKLIAIKRKWMDGWMNEWMNEWMSEWMNGWMNEGMNERVEEQWLRELCLRCQFLMNQCPSSVFKRKQPRLWCRHPLHWNQARSCRILLDLFGCCLILLDDIPTAPSCKLLSIAILGLPLLRFIPSSRDSLGCCRILSTF